MAEEATRILISLLTIYLFPNPLKKRKEKEKEKERKKKNSVCLGSWELEPEVKFIKCLNEIGSKQRDM